MLLCASFLVPRASISLRFRSNRTISQSFDLSDAPEGRSRGSSSRRRHRLRAAARRCSARLSGRRAALLLPRYDPFAWRGAAAIEHFPVRHSRRS